MKGFSGAIGFILFYCGFIGFIWILTYLGFNNDVVGGGSRFTDTGNYTYKNETTTLSAFESFVSIYTKQEWLSWLTWAFTLVLIWIIISWVRGITP